MPSQTNIAIVDDHPMTRYALGELIKATYGYEIVAECESPGIMRAVLNHQQIDLLIIDLMFDDGSGIELLEYLQIKHSSIRPIVFTMRDERHYAQRCFRAGARGYVCKKERLSRITDAIQTVMNGGRYISEWLSGVMMEDTSVPKADGLSNRELEVLQFIGRGMDTRQIAESICRSPKTVETYRYRIKKKLGLHNSVELAQYACMHSTGGRFDNE